MDQVLARGQEAPLFHGHVAGHLDHPRLIGMRCDAGHVDLPTRKVDKKQYVIRHLSRDCTSSEQLTCFNRRNHEMKAKLALSGIVPSMMSDANQEAAI